MKPPFFVLGRPRSGTTLLRNLLRSHPDLTVPPESHFLPAFYLAYGDPAGERAARRLAARTLRLHWVQRWGLDATPGDFADCRSYDVLVDRLYAAYAVREDASRWGDKTPQYTRWITVLAQIFPQARGSSRRRRSTGDRTSVRAARRRTFESVAGDLLAELGYEVDPVEAGPGRVRRPPVSSGSAS